MGSKEKYVVIGQKNLLHVFAALDLRPNTSRHVLSKGDRWAIHLSRIEFSTSHIEVVNNMFARKTHNMVNMIPVRQRPDQINCNIVL